MTIAFPCEKCGYRFEVDGNLAGKKCKCKHCGHVFVIPVPRAAAGVPRVAQAAAPRPETRPTARTKPDPIPTVDPYGLDDEPVASPATSRPAIRELDDEDFVAPRSFVPLKSNAGKAKARSGGSFLGAIPVWVYLAVAAVFVVTGFLALVNGTAAVVFTVLIGVTIFTLWAVGTTGLIVVPFGESAACGLMNLFLPFYGLYYLVTRWDAMRPWFLTNLAGTGVLIFSAVFLPFVAATWKVANEAVLQGQQQQAEFAGAQPAPRPSAVAPVLVPAEALANPGPATPPGFNAPPVVANRPGPATPPGLPNTPNKRGGLLSRVRDRSNNPAAGNAPGNGQNPAETVTLDVSGLDDRDTRDDFRAKLTEVVRGLGGNNPGLRSTVVRGRGNYTVWPVADPQALADRIDFAKVVAVDGRTITVEAIKAAPDRSRAGRSTAAADDGDPIDQALSLLSEPTSRKRKDGLGRLQRAAVVPDRRAEVAKAIEPVLRDPDGFTRADAAKALGVWGGPENVGALTAALRDDDFHFRGAVFDALAALHDPASAEPVAAFLDSQQDRGRAAKVLKAIGPDAEKAVIPYLDHREVFTRVEACKVLQAVGTQASVKPLQVMYRKTGGQGLDAMAADEAARAIRSFNASSKSKPGSGR